MQNIPRPSNFVASAIAILMVVGVLAFIGGIGSGALKFQDAQFNLIAGFLFGAGTTVLAFYFGASSTQNAGQRRAADFTPASPPAPPAQPEK